MHWSVHSALGLAAVAMATAAGAPAAAQSKRPTIAVLAFEYGTVQQWWSGTWDIGEGISDLIVDELVNDGSFRVIERKRLDAILAEQNFSNSERADPSAKTMAQIGKVLGVKYLVVGSITKFGTEKSNKSFSGGGYGSAFGLGSVGTSKGKANVAITARIIDITTRRDHGERQGRRHLEAQRPAARRRRRWRRRWRVRRRLVRLVRVPRHDPRRSHRDGRQGHDRQARRGQDPPGIASPYSNTFDQGFAARRRIPGRSVT